MSKTDAPAQERVVATTPTTVASARLLWLLGPALVAGVAYPTPGNVASNMTAGARYGYLLVWVVVAGNVMAWLIQYLSAKLGIVTGTSLPEILGARMKRPLARRLYWIQAELVAMATDLAEIIGGAVALNLLFDLPAPGRRGDHGRHLDDRALGADPPRPRAFERVVIALLADHRRRFHRGHVLCPAGRRIGPGRTDAALRGHQFGAPCRVDPRCDDHAARHLRALVLARDRPEWRAEGPPAVSFGRPAGM